MNVCVTNRTLCKGDFLKRIESLADAGVDCILLREKDLPQAEYAALAKACQEICSHSKTSLWLHSFPEVAAALELPVHLPFQQLLTLSAAWKQCLPAYGASIHAPEEAVQAQQAGASWVIAGHIFATACKPGLPPRGIAFLQQVCKSVSIPVYAIGGITSERQQEVLQAGAAGCCVMSAWMQCDNPQVALTAWR